MVTQRLREAFARQDLAAFLELLDPDVTWTWWEPEPACRNRDDVRRRIREVLAEGQWGRPEVIAEGDDRLVVDPHADPPMEIAPDLHQVFTFRDDRIVRIEDYPNRATALEAAQLS